MAGPSRDSTEGVSSEGKLLRWRNGLGLLTILFGLLALLSPLRDEEVPGGRAGAMLILTAVVEIIHGFRRSTWAGQRAAWIGGAITLAMGILLVDSPFFASSAIVYLLAGWFAIDAIRYLFTWHRQETQKARVYSLLAMLGNLVVAVVLLEFPLQTMAWTVAIAAALRIFGTASNIFTLPVHEWSESSETFLKDLGLPEDPELEALTRDIQSSEASRIALDRGWIIGYLLTLFAIHLGRMGLDPSALRILSPVVAVAGDVFIGLLLAFLILMPLMVAWHRGTRVLERRAWKWCLAVPAQERGWSRRLLKTGLTRRLRHAMRLRQARYGLGSALHRGLQIGLPLAAIVAATFPMWGMSWYFDTENWASGIWNSWAASRTDEWRQAMVSDVLAASPPTPPSETLAVHPPGITAGQPFSFIVIGDTGEGDDSQFSLLPQLQLVARRDDVKFIIISSDVVYPTGAMRDYERKFWLPFLGIGKPIYAIPGNHDWYDALEGFNATFLKPDAARLAMRARLELDKRISSTTDHRIDQLIAQASRYGKEYRVKAQLQQAPYFQFQTDRFALFAIDTGVVKGLDPVQWNWLKGALESAKGKTKMALLGHPLYAGGHYSAAGNEEFQALHQLLKEHDVAITMGGDTHDLEYYLERGTHPNAPVHHFVNGGGGAYLSFGTPLAWPETVPAREWAYYPAKKQVTEKIEATTSWWKWPAWWWTKTTGGWPFSAEFLAAAFDVNTAPYYQSFMEIRVDPAAGQIRLIPYGIHGRLSWTDLDHSPGVVPAGANVSGPVEWIVPFRK